MKRILIRNATVIDPRSAVNGKKRDLLIEDGIIRSVESKSKTDGAQIIEAENLHVSPGWFDMRVNIPDPGHEYKDDLTSVVHAAAEGGITAFACTATSHPARDSKSAIEYVINRNRSQNVRVYPMGSLSENREGKDIAEMYDMFQAGAVAFGDDKHAVRDTGLLSRALDYSRRFDALITSFPYDHSLSPSGKVNEGIAATMLGLRGIPHIAESMAVARDISLVRYTKGKLHFITLSTAEAVELIRQAKKESLKITSEVAAHNLLLTDEELHRFDSNFKTLPPLRTGDDCKSLVQGLIDGSIDVICSDHTPEDVEEKEKEFDHAAYGISGIQTLFSVARTATKDKLPLAALIEKISINPRRILGIPLPSIDQNEIAELTLFDPDKTFTFSKSHLLTKSKNTPYDGMSFTGMPLGIVSKGAYYKAVNNK